MTASSRDAIVHLTALADRLAGHASLHIDRCFEQSPPRLSIRNVDMRDGRGWELLSGSVLVLAERGRNWFVWDDGHRVGPVDALDVAVQRVVVALTISGVGAVPERAESSLTGWPSPDAPPVPLDEPAPSGARVTFNTCCADDSDGTR